MGAYPVTPRRLLALDTATEACTVALQVDGEQRHRREVSARGHTRLLPAMVAELLAEAGLSARQLDGLICGIGPGSFAGVRIGVGYAQGLAWAADLPVLGVTSLEMLAEGGQGQRVLTVIDARLSAVYAAAWVREGEGWWACMAPQVCPPEALPAAPEGDDWQGRGSGFGPYAEVLQTAWGSTLTRIDATALPDARDALRLGAARVARGEAAAADQLAPLYLRDKVALTLEEQQALRAARAG